MRLFTLVPLVLFCCNHVIFASEQNQGIAPVFGAVATGTADSQDDPAPQTSPSVSRISSSSKSTSKPSDKPSSASSTVMKTSSTRTSTKDQTTNTSDHGFSSLTDPSFTFTSKDTSSTRKSFTTTEDGNPTEVFTSTNSTTSSTATSSELTVIETSTSPPSPVTTPFQPPVNQTSATPTVATIIPPATASSTPPASPLGHCAPGTTCAASLGVGLGIGSVALIGAFLVFSGRYRRFLAASQQSYRDHRRRRHSAHEEYGMGKDNEDVNMTSLNTAQNAAPPPEYRKNDELFLPDDVQQVVRNVDSMRQQRMRMPTESYGTVSRKPLPKSTNF